MSPNKKGKVQSVECPDFALGDLKEFPIEIFQTNDATVRRLHALMTSLALAFNDTKTFFWVNHQLQKGESKVLGINAYDGQWIGMSEHIRRLIFSALFEITKALHENKDLLEHELFKKSLAACPKTAQTLWKRFMSLVNEGNQRDLSKREKAIILFLINVRDNISYHYYQPERLFKGYDRWFKTGPNEKGFCSYGQTREETRFYFADRIASEYAQETGQRFGVTVQDVYEFIRDAHTSLRFLLEKYIQNLEH